MRNRKPLAVAATVLLYGLVSSCSEPGADSPGVTAPPFTQRVRSIAVSPATAAVQVGKTVQLKATAKPTRSATTFTWTTSNAQVATVTAGGLVTGVAAGRATISATAGGVSGTAEITVSATTIITADAVVVGAGDISGCDTDGDAATAALLDGIAGTVYNLGDNAYSDGTAAQYTDCYGPTWGRHKARTRPTPGNHEYNTTNASGYFGYFGAAAGDPAKGYYSYDLGTWHIIVLNSNSSCSTVSCAAGSAQEQWLRADLAAHPAQCTLAYWHHPRFNSGSSHGNNTAVAPFWDALYAAGAEIVLNGHEHVYERFAPQTPSAAADPTRGVRQFTVGTGGRSHYSFGTIKPNSEVRNATTYGVLKLTLRTGGYDWKFVPVAGASFTDSGSGTCH